MGLLFIGFMP